MGTREKIKSPLKKRPLRQAGQSLNEEIQNIYSENIDPYVFIICLVIVFSAAEWFRYFRNFPPQPWITSIIAIILVFVSTARIFSLKKKIKNLELGRDGEKILGESLDNLRGKGCQVFHDVIGESFNLDHVLIAPQGIFVIETKTRSKPIRGEARLSFNGTNILINGRVDSESITQAKSGAKWFQGLLKELTDNYFQVRPILIYLGWFIEKMPSELKKEIWVINEKNLESFLEHERLSLNKEEIQLISKSVEIYIRNNQP
jgi:hypothetical protein